VRAATGDPLTDTDAWFLEHGLTYFVPEQRARVRRALAARRVVPFLVVVVLVATGLGYGGAWFTDETELGPAIAAFLIGVGVVGYGLVALRAAPIVTWALGRTWGSLRTLLPMTTRALPLLLLFITFLFVNTEVWQVGSNLTAGALGLVVMLFVALAVVFLLVRLPEEVDRVDDDVNDRLVLEACAGTPLESEARRLVDDPDIDPAAYGEVTGYERWNLVIVLAVIQMVQVLLVAVSVFAFLMVFGSLIMTQPVMDAWLTSPTHSVPRFESISVALLQVSIFLSAFSGLYLTVSTVTDETYRAQFFGGVLHQMERAVGVRAVYLSLRQER
jgi:hypothetical protein